MTSEAMIPMGRSRLGILALFGGGGDGIEADIGEENDRAAGEHSLPAVGHEGLPVGGWMYLLAATQKTRMASDLDAHHHVVGARGFADPTTSITVRIITITKPMTLKCSGPCRCLGE